MKRNIDIKINGNPMLNTPQFTIKESKLLLRLTKGYLNTTKTTIDHLEEYNDLIVKLKELVVFTYKREEIVKQKAP